MAKTLYLDAKKSDHIEQAARMLLEGKLVAFPTETVYGLGALAMEEHTVKGIYAAKNRPSENPLIIHVPNIEMASELFDFMGSAHKSDFLSRFQLLACSFWPGPITLVGKKAQAVSDLVTSGSSKVAVRIPSHPVALKLLQLVAKPIAAPSANLFTRPSPTAFKHVLANLNDRVDAALDGGPCEYGIESTVIDIDNEAPKILRHGAITFDELSRVVPHLTMNAIGAIKDITNASPGLSKKHYSPNIARVLLASEMELAKAWFSSCGIILRKATELTLIERLGARPIAAGPIKTLPNDSKGCAKELFLNFYEMESKSLQILLVEDLLPLAACSEWAGVCDRLIRASTASAHETSRSFND